MAWMSAVIRAVGEKWREKTMAYSTTGGRRNQAAVALGTGAAERMKRYQEQSAS
jgi:hypothetical protein